METIFQNEHFVVVDKPSGMLSVPARFKEDDRPVVGLLLEQELKQKIFPVHRLDYEVSGLLLFAKSQQAHREANSWFEKKEIKKIYQAITQGAAPELNATFQWKSKILRGKKRAYESPVGKPSVTNAKFLHSRKNEKFNLLFWELEPVTGRSHQLRFDLSRYGFPIIGDSLYGSTIPFAPNSIALRAVRIEFSEKSKKWGLPNVLFVSDSEQIFPDIG